MKRFMNKKSLAFAICAALIVGIVTYGGIGLAGTYAAPGDYTETFTDPYTGYTPINVGAQTTLNLTNAYRWVNTNSEVLELTPATGPSVTVKGLSAGISSVSAGTTMGQVIIYRYKVVDTTNASSYVVANGLFGYLNGQGGTLTIPVTTAPSGAANKIQWASTNNSVASVSASGGNVTANVDSGTVMMLGTVTDQWGVSHTIPYAVIIGSGSGSGGSSGIDNLLSLIDRAEKIIAQSPNPYTPGSIGNLQAAVYAGKAVAGSQNPAEQTITNAINGLLNAIDNLVANSSGGLIHGGNGEWYKPVGVPPHVYEKTDSNGNSKNPPEYVYNPNGAPGDGSDVAVVPGDGKYWTEDAPGNIWVPIDNGGNLDGNNAVWGGNDGKPGGGDDKAVVKKGGEWWLNMGQNVWQKVTGKNTFGPLIGGGPDKDPSTDPVDKIYDNTAKDGKYYVGPLTDNDGNEYYYGDKENGNGLLDSTAAGAANDDVTYYKDANGNMTTTVPDKMIGNQISNAKSGDIIVIDGREWIKIRTDSPARPNYVLLMMNDSIKTNGSEVQLWPYANNDGLAYEFGNSTIKDNLSGWWDGLNSPTLKKMAVRANTGTAPTGSWPSVGTSGVYAHIPRAVDMAYLPYMLVPIDADYWLAEPTSVSGMGIDYQIIVKKNGSQIEQKNYTPAGVRPIVWVNLDLLK